jgi:hypothetical protein
VEQPKDLKEQPDSVNPLACNDLLSADSSFDVAECRERCRLSIMNTPTGKWLGRALDEIQRLKRITDPPGKQRAELFIAKQQIGVLLRSIERGGMDLAPCRLCSDPVVCIPDGLPMCASCAEKESAEQ